MPSFGLIIFSIFIFGLIALFYGIRLKTEINQNEIIVNFFPFIRKRINRNEIKSAKTLDYGFVGGWGIRVWTEYGTIYNTKGSKGLAIELNSGKKILIGTQKEAELNKIIEKCL